MADVRELERQSREAAYRIRLKARVQKADLELQLRPYGINGLQESPKHRPDVESEDG